MTLSRSPYLALKLAVLVSLCAAAGVPNADDQARPLKGSYQIRNKKFAESDLVLRPRNASSAEKTPIVLYPRTDWKCLTWKVSPAAEGAAGERLINHFTNKTFRPAAKPAEGDTSVPVLQVTPARGGDPAEQWTFVATGKDTYRIVHVATGWVLTAEKADDDVRIVIAPWSDRDEQKWQVLDGPVHFSA